MKKAFTLIELLIVIAVVSILMGLVFRLSSIGEDSYRRTETVSRLHRLENCLSGYNAAFGCYPPVALHGSRDIYRRVGTHGLQTQQRNTSIFNWRNIGDKDEVEAWSQVKAACKAQPLDCRYPFAQGYQNFILTLSEEMARRAGEAKKDHYEKYGYNDPSKQKRLQAQFNSGYDNGTGRFDPNESQWRKQQLFKFGLLSFLVPRYLVMMNSHEDFFRSFSQWTDNNTLPRDPFDDNELSWDDIYDLADPKNGNNRMYRAKLYNIPSQAVCARWMPNLAGICRANKNITLFGVDIRDKSKPSELDVENADIELFSPDGDENDSATSRQYVLDGITVLDGWDRELYYYSPEPHQRYVLWSAGANGRTFPPWISRDSFDSSDARRCIGMWTVDDIVQMSN